MANKQPYVKEQVSAKKTPKTQQNPDGYKDHAVCWQLHTIDFDGIWGIDQIKNSVEFLFKSDLLETLRGISNATFDTIIDLDKRRFPSLNSFLQTISNNCANQITIEHQRHLIASIAENIFWIEIFPRLRHFETTDWHTIEKEQYGGKGKTKHHYVSVSKIIPQARKRLKELKLEDIDELFSLRLTGKIRIWGMRRYNYFQVLWIDLEHEVCPTSKD